MKKAKNVKVGMFVCVPVYCFAPMRSGWNGWEFSVGQIMEFGTCRNTGKRLARVEWGTYRNESLSKWFAVDELFDPALSLWSYENRIKEFGLNSMLENGPKDTKWLIDRGALQV